MPPPTERESRFFVKSRHDGETLSMSWTQPDGETMDEDDRREIWMFWRTGYGAFAMRFVRVDLPDGRRVFTSDPESWTECSPPARGLTGE